MLCWLVPLGGRLPEGIESRRAPRGEGRLVIRWIIRGASRGTSSGASRVYEGARYLPK